MRAVDADLYRYTGSTGSAAWFSAVRQYPGFRYTWLLRTVQRHRAKRLTIGALPYWFARVLLHHYRFRYGFEISPTTAIGAGLYLAHFGGVVINPAAVIGRNVNIAQGVTIGATSRGKRLGAPVLEDCVWVGANAIIVGAVTVGRESLIAPGAYVNFDVPARSLVLGNPGKIVGDSGSDGYINNVPPEASAERRA